jgi:hypothetical protein
LLLAHQEAGAGTEVRRAGQRGLHNRSAPSRKRERDPGAIIFFAADGTSRRRRSPHICLRAEGFIFSRLLGSACSHVINARRKGEKWFSALSGELLLIFAPDRLGDFEHSASNYSRNLISTAEISREI